MWTQPGCDGLRLLSGWVRRQRMGFSDHRDDRQHGQPQGEENDAAMALTDEELAKVAGGSISPKITIKKKGGG